MNTNTQQLYIISFYITPLCLMYWFEFNHDTYVWNDVMIWVLIWKRVLWPNNSSWIYNSSNWKYIYEFLDDMNLRFKIYVLSRHNKLWNQHSSNHFLKHGNYFLEILPKHRGQNCWNMSSRSFPRPEAGHRCIYDGESAVCKSSKTHSLMKVQSRWSLNPTCQRFHSK